MEDELKKEILNFEELVKSSNKVGIACTMDPDSIASACVLAKTFSNIKKLFCISFNNNIDCDLKILLKPTSNQEGYKFKDSEKFESTKGLSLAEMSYLFCKSIDPNIIDHAVLITTRDIPTKGSLSGEIISDYVRSGKEYSKLKEYRDLLIACSKLKRGSIGIGMLLGDKNYFENARVIHGKYKEEINNSARKSEILYESASYKILKTSVSPILIKEVLDQVSKIGKINALVSSHEKGFVCTFQTDRMDIDIEKMISSIGKFKIVKQEKNLLVFFSDYRFIEDIKNLFDDKEMEESIKA